MSDTLEGISMSGGIFLLQKDGGLEEMREQSYDSESVLQELLERYPNLLAGDQMNENDPRKWLLISREMNIPDNEAGNNRWAVDHLFLDQDGIPTLVEVKRSEDTRVRREVVGQMLDYAANSVAYWSVEEIRMQFEHRCEEKGIEPDVSIQSAFESEKSLDAYWQMVSDNLGLGKLRLVFVADEIPAELKQIVEFLNEQMSPAEVLAVEIKQFVGQKETSFVPRVIGQTSKAQKKKSLASRSKRKWDRKQFLEELRSRHSRKEQEVAEQIIQWANNKGLRFWWGEGAQNGSFFPVLDHENDAYTLFSLWTYGSVEIQFQYLKTHNPYYERKEHRLELLQQLNAIPNVSIPEDGIERRPSFQISFLNESANLHQFLEVWDQVIENIESNQTNIENMTLK